MVGDAELRRSIDYFPVVGLLLGGMIAAIGWLFAKCLPSSVAGTLLVVALAILTRALHLDGLADTADGIGSGKEPVKALEIMKDSRTGAFGVVAVALVLLMKMQGFIALCDKEAWFSLALVPCLSRFGLNVLAAFSVYARQSGGLGRYFVGKEVKARLWLPFSCTLAFCWCFLEQAGVLLCLLVAIISLLTSRYFQKRLGGVTGDVLGAHVEILEAIVPMVMVVF